MGLYPANSIFVGDYLTTVGQSASNDLAMIRDAGFVLENPDGSVLATEEQVNLNVEFKQSALSRD
jgi:biotin synthase